MMIYSNPPSTDMQRPPDRKTNDIEYLPCMSFSNECHTTTFYILVNEAPMPCKITEALGNDTLLVHTATAEPRVYVTAEPDIGVQ